MNFTKTSDDYPHTIWKAIPDDNPFSITIEYRIYKHALCKTYDVWQNLDELPTAATTLSQAKTIAKTHWFNELENFNKLKMVSLTYEQWRDLTDVTENVARGMHAEIPFSENIHRLVKILVNMEKQFSEDERRLHSIDFQFAKEWEEMDIVDRFPPQMQVNEMPDLTIGKTIPTPDDLLRRK